MIAFVRATDAHLPGIMGVIAQAFDAGFGELWNEDQVIGALGHPDRVGEVVLADAIVIAFSIARYAAEEGELLLVAVSPSWRRRGIGAALIDNVLDQVRARGGATMFLEVRDANDAAGALYRARGFEAVGRRKGYYAGRDQRRHDAITMRRCL